LCSLWLILEYFLVFLHILERDFFFNVYAEVMHSFFIYIFICINYAESGYVVLPQRKKVYTLKRLDRFCWNLFSIRVNTSNTWLQIQNIAHFQQFILLISLLRFCWYSNLSNVKLKNRNNQIKAQYSLSELICYNHIPIKNFSSEKNVVL
jgi:hypothetical protein